MANTHGSHDEQRATSQILSNTLAIAGLIILIVVLIWGLLHLGSLASGWLSSLFGSGASTAIEIDAPREMKAGEPVEVRWRHKTSERGHYAFAYQCREGLGLTLMHGESYVEIPCEVAFALAPGVQQATILPLLAGTTSTDTLLSVVFVPDTPDPSAGAAQGSIPVVVSGGSAEAAARPLPEPQTPSAPRPALSAQGPADLSLTITSVFADPYGNGTVTFDIANVGGSSSGTYYFTAQLPTSQPYTYFSPAQPPLAPGSHVVNTLTFSSAVSGTVSVSVSGDGNTGNNHASRHLSASYGGPYTNYETTPAYFPPQTNYGSGQCYMLGGAYVCPSQQYGQQYNYLPYYYHSGQYPYIAY